MLILNTEKALNLTLSSQLNISINERRKYKRRIFIKRIQTYESIAKTMGNFNGSTLYCYKDALLSKLTEKICIPQFRKVKITNTEISQFKLKCKNKKTNTDRNFIASDTQTMKTWIKLIENVMHNNESFVSDASNHSQVNQVMYALFSIGYGIAENSESENDIKNNENDLLIDES